ncbi:quinone oxidoreductase family protein [Nocardioides cynanchi]|uniref:quinone oxidoreductase family protein n=1 Tax=Nocardioides cynanchi TaxID=2558918 RepID=UPI001243E98C|nr:zinc-binding alcohol dehydrogenase family protein [Nocardioides cynanchi]
MRAAVLHTPGSPPSYGEHPAPEPAAGSTLVRVRAAPVVPLDLLCASGTAYLGVPATPYVPGGQGVGVVEVSETHEPGTRVWFFTPAGMAPGDGSLAELCLVPDGDVVPLEVTVPDDLAAALGLSGVAAWMALSWRAGLVAGERVLVLGGGGAVGQAGIGAAHALGAAQVVAVARPGSADRARAAGAEVVVPLDTHDVDELTASLAQHGPFDVVLDPVFGVSASAAAGTLAPGGRLVNLGGASGDAAVFSSAGLRSRSAAVLGYTNNALTPEQRTSAVTAVLEHAAAGRIRMAYDVVPLADVEAAWLRQAAGTGSRGVVRPS